MELSWRAGLMEFAMPFFIQVTSELTSRVETVQKKHEDREKKEEQIAKKQQNETLDAASDLGYMVPQQLMLGGGPQ
jgi:clathrin heavy chain